MIALYFNFIFLSIDFIESIYCHAPSIEIEFIFEKQSKQNGLSTAHYFPSVSSPFVDCAPFRRFFVAVNK